MFWVALPLQYGVSPKCTVEGATGPIIIYGIIAFQLGLFNEINDKCRSYFMLLVSHSSPVSFCVLVYIYIVISTICPDSCGFFLHVVLIAIVSGYQKLVLTLFVTLELHASSSRKDNPPVSSHERRVGLERDTPANQVFFPP